MPVDACVVSKSVIYESYCRKQPQMAAVAYSYGLACVSSALSSQLTVDIERLMVLSALSGQVLVI